jgi:hypothetical protein
MSEVGGSCGRQAAVRVMGHGEQVELPELPELLVDRNSGKFASAAAGRRVDWPFRGFRATQASPLRTYRLPTSVARRNLGGDDQAIAAIVIWVEVVRSVHLPFHEAGELEQQRELRRD